MQNRNLLRLLIASAFLILVWSAIKPKDLFTWALEVFPAVLGFAILLATRKRFPLTTLAYVCVWVHSIILIIGGHYTYAEMPLFNWIRDEFGFSRNNYDKVGHFAQGFFPAILVREILIRRTPLRPGGWLFFIVVSICESISAVYELLEWAVAVSTGSKGDAFLGTQGYVWDTQSDMALCLIGAVTSLLLLTRIHDRHLERLQYGKDAPSGESMKRPAPNSIPHD